MDTHLVDIASEINGAGAIADTSSGKVALPGRSNRYRGDPDGPVQPDDEEPELEEAPGPETPLTESAGRPRGRFSGRWPDESEELPELEYWDSDRTLPKGAIGVLYGTKGSHKTGIALTKAFEAMLTGGASICYAVGEGAHGLEKQRVPAQCRKRGIKPESLRGRWLTVPAVPLFASDAEVLEFIQAVKAQFACYGTKPGIVLIDTWATAIAGEDENGSKASAFLTGNGPAGRIRDALGGATVLVVSHPGKDEGRGMRGHSGCEANADFVLHAEANKKAGAVKVTVEKMRDGPDGFSVYFAVPPQGSPEVPVPTPIRKGDYEALAKDNGSTGGGADPIFAKRAALLTRLNARNYQDGLPERRFAEEIVRAEGGTPDAADWGERVAAR
jgi:AAA domain